MARLKPLLVQSILILLIITTEASVKDQQRSKRDLQFIKNLFTHALHGKESAPVKLPDNNGFVVPKGYKVIYVKRFPEKIPLKQPLSSDEKLSALETFLGTKTTKESEKAMIDANNLVKTGIVTANYLTSHEHEDLKISQDTYDTSNNEYREFFLNELHVPTFVPTKPFTDTITNRNSEAPFVIPHSSGPPRTSYGVPLNNSFVINAAAPVVYLKPTEQIGNRYSYKQINDDSTIEYNGSIRTEHIPDRVVKYIKYMAPPPFFIKRIEKINTPAITDNIGSQYAQVINNYDTLQQQKISDDTYNYNHVVPTSNLPYHYRYILTGGPYNYPYLAVNFNSDINTPNFNDHSYNYERPLPTRITDNNFQYVQTHSNVPPKILGIENSGVNEEITRTSVIHNSPLDTYQYLPKPYVKYFKPEDNQITHLYTNAYNVNSNPNYRYSYVQTTNNGDNVIYKDGQVINYDVVTKKHVPEISTVSHTSESKYHNEPTSITHYPYSDAVPKPTDNDFQNPVKSDSGSSTNINLPSNTFTTFNNNNQQLTNHLTSTHKIQNIQEDIVSTSIINNRNKEINVEHTNRTDQSKRRKIYRRVKLKKNEIKNTETKEVKPQRVVVEGNEKSWNNSPIVVLPKSNSTFSYKQTNEDGSTRSIQSNGNDVVVVNVEKTSEKYGNRGDTPL